MAFSWLASLSTIHTSAKFLWSLSWIQNAWTSRDLLIKIMSWLPQSINQSSWPIHINTWQLFNNSTSFIKTKCCGATFCIPSVWSPYCQLSLMSCSHQFLLTVKMDSILFSQLLDTGQAIYTACPQADLTDQFYVN